MTFDSLLVFATLIIAIYSIVPEYKRLELKLRWGCIDWVLLFGALVLIHYLLFFQFFRKIGFSPGLNLYKLSISPSSAAYLSLLFFSSVMAVHLSTIKLSKKKIFKFRNFTNELLTESRFADLVKVLEKRLTELKKVYAADFFFSRLKRRLAPRSIAEVLFLLEKEKQTNQSRTKKFFTKALKNPMFVVGRALPDYSEAQEAAQDVVRSFMLSNDFAVYVAKARPYFAIDIYRNEFTETDDFSEVYFKTILSNTTSIFYQEIKNNQNLSKGNAYYIPYENRLLSFFFSDTSVGEKFAVYRPVGEFIISHLDNLYRDKDKDIYNYPMEDYQERTQWGCPLFVGIRFFDIMVSSALHQNIEWHMWLYYFTHFTKKIVRNYSPQEGYVNLESEFPTKYNYILYEMISALRSWVRDLEALPEDQKNILLSEVSINNENGNIPKSAILALGQCLHHILTSEKITQEFKSYMASIAFNLYFDLYKVEKTRPYSHVLKLSLKQGGGYRYKKDQYYLTCLIDAFVDFDKIPHEHEAVKEFEEFLIS